MGTRYHMLNDNLWHWHFDCQILQTSESPRKTAVLKGQRYPDGPLCADCFDLTEQSKVKPVPKNSSRLTREEEAALIEAASIDPKETTNE